MAQQQQMGLFGPTPTDILRAQQAADQDLALRQAQLAPGQGLIYQAASAGQRAGRNIAGLFGIEDPALKEATEMDAVKKVVASQWDGSDPEKALELFVQEANKRGLTQQALSASERLTKMKADRETGGLKRELLQAQIGKTGAEQTKAEADAEKARREEKTTTIGKVDPDKFTPESIQKYSETRNFRDLVRNPETVKQFSEPYPMAGADGKQILVQRNLQTGQIEPIDKAARVNVSATSGMPPQEVEFQKQIGQEDAKAVVKARELRTTAINELGSLNEMATRNQQNITSGTFASGRVGVANFFNTIGLLGPNDVKKLANSEVYTKSAGDLVLAKIKALGSNPSNADREFIVRIVPQLENSPQARAELISYLQKRANDVIKETGSLETYARQNKGLSGYTPTIPLTISPQTAKKASDMTDQELIDAYKSGRR
jgi:hypothetical protein